MKIKFEKDDILVIMTVISNDEASFTILGDEDSVTDAELECMAVWHTPEGWKVV